MKLKSKLILLGISIGVISCFGFNNSQAAEITSVFSGETITRNTIATLASTSQINTNVVPVTLGITQSEYKTNNGNVYWTIKDSSGEYEDLYCLNIERGFGAPNGNITNLNSVKEYTSEYNLNTINNQNYTKYIGLTETNKNKILWILNNSLISNDSLTTILTAASKKVDITSIGLTNKDIESFIKEDMVSNTRTSTKLTFNDIKMVQQIAIWHYTNNTSVFENTLGAICNSQGRQISGLMEENINTDGYGTFIWNGKVKQAKLNAIYKYFIDGAESGTSGAEIPTLILSNTDVIVTDEGDNYIVGPFSLNGTNIQDIKSITADVNVDYILLNSSKAIITNNDFNRVIGNNFYLKIAKSKIIENTDIAINLTYKYDEKQLILLTDRNDPENTQPVVLVKSEDKDPSINTNATIEITNISVKKEWNDNNNQDNIRPSSVEVQLYKTVNNNTISMGRDYKITLNESNNWTYTWEKLLDGEYIVKELNKLGIEINDNEQYNENYITSYTIQENNTIITNVHIPETVQKTVTKIWEDNDNQDGKRTEYGITLKANGIVYGEEVKLNAETLTYTWRNLPKYENGEEIKYTVEETTIPDEYKPIYSEDTFTITNTYTPGKVSKKVVKQWDDQEDKDKIRPNSVTVKLYKTINGEKEEISTQKLDETNNWAYIWNELDKKENGIDIVYSIEENSVNKYTTTYSAEDYSNTDIITITNTYTPIEITGKYNVVLRKVDENGNILTGSRFKVNGTEYDLSRGEVIIYENQQISSEVPIDFTYIIEETMVPVGYNGIENTEVNIKAQVQRVNNNYKLIRATLVDSEGNNITDEHIFIKLEGESIVIEVKNTPIEKEFDLALRKFITKINEETYSREPKIDTSKLGTIVNGKTVTTAIYKHSKEPIAVQKGDIVTYTIRVYNEGEIDGYVDKITDYLPDHLLPIIIGTEGIDEEEYADEIEFNLNWGWIVSEDGKAVTTMKTAKVNSDTYSMLEGYENVTDTKLEAYVEGSNKLDYIDVQIKCLVTDSAIGGEYLTNIAEITDSQDIKGNKGDGFDSELNNVDYSNLSDYKNNEAINSTTESYIPGQEDDDDFEKLVVKEFDLSLRKFITKVNEITHSREPKVDTSKLRTIVNGKTITTATYIHTKEPVIVETSDLVTYKIRIYNEGTIAGFANEITDDIPEGLEFLPDSDINVSYRWKMLDKDGKETEDVKKAVMIITDYLSDRDANNIIREVVESNGEKTLSYKDVEVQFKVIAKAEKLKDNIIINEAQISEDSDRDIDSIPNRDEKYDYTTGKNEDDIDYEPIKLQYFDLSLRKFITKVNSTDYNNRYPEIKFNDDGSITYNHTKDPVLVTTGDTVIYTIRVYNEGEKAGYATEIKDNLPEGLAFDQNNETNKLYGWKMIDKEGNVTEEAEKVVAFKTNYLENEKIDALVEVNGSKVLSYKDVQIAFIVTESNMSNRILVNTAQISADSDDDIDSTPDNSIESEDDIDKEYVKVEYFDLALKKWVTETRVTLDGKTTTTKTGFTEDSTGIAKVDIVASKLKKTTVKFVYNIKITNEGELPGYAYEVKDYIPNGLKFVAEDNKDWKQEKDGTVVTDKLKDTLLNPGESATVEIVLTWKNSSTNLGVKTNYAEISNDSGDDIDSTPDNYDFTEDDIDDAQVILSIKTAGKTTYIGLVLISIAILAGGIFLIKKYVLD